MPVVNYDWDEIEDNIDEEYDDDGNTIVDYTTEPTLHGPIISQNRAGVTSHYHFDGLGNTTELTNDSGNVTDTRRYTAFGEVTSGTGSSYCAYLFGAVYGFYHDTETGNIVIRPLVYQSDNAQFASGHIMTVESASDPDDLLSLLRGTFPFLNSIPAIPGPCWTIDVRVTARATHILDLQIAWLPAAANLLLAALRRLGFERTIVLAVNQFIPNPLEQSVSARQCPLGSRCCTLLSWRIRVTMFIKIRATGVVTATVFIPFRQQVKVNYTAQVAARVSSRTAIDIGVCVPNGCDCPEELGTTEADVTFGSEETPIDVDYSIPLPEQALN